ncbi:hypothetical protein [Aestuariibius sp. HNIBRBA575]|uniref:hypothetical protein n=1 Tax=Aestuariibius sp. HNIBRBA575 TaxID=3233343 RepID=UPI0034A136B9
MYLNPIKAAAALMVFATPALADYSCAFDRECVDADACAATDFTVDVQKTASILGTVFGDLMIIASKGDDNLHTYIAAGDGADYLMSVTPNGAIFTTHIADGPMSITYLGTCQGAF